MRGDVRLRDGACFVAHNAVRKEQQKVVPLSLGGGERRRSVSQWTGSWFSMAMETY